jgi:TP901 family phage tail tape measure protein
MNIAALTIPAIFTAVDRLTAPFRNMNSAVSGFARNAEVAAARADRAFNKMLPSFGNATNEVIGYTKSILGVSAAIGAITFTGKSIMQFEDAVLSFRTIVSDLTDNQFTDYEKQIGVVADITKKSSVDIAKSFEVIAGLNAEFANTAEGLGLVTQSVSTLAKASRMDMGSAAENLIGIMNQFNYTVEQSDRVINVLAAGQAVGAASISQTADALKNFGAVAKGANITIEESTGLIQLLASKGQLGAEAGSRLRAAIVKLQAAGVGYASGVFNINDGLTELKKQYDALRTPMERDAMLSKTFGLESITTGSILLNNIDAFKQFTASVKDTSEAQKAAEINSRSLSVRLQELQDRFVTIITTADTTKGGLGLVSGAISWLTDNMGWMLDIAVPLIGVLLSVKAAIWGIAFVSKVLKTAQIALNFVMGISTALNGTYATSAFATIAGMNGMAVGAGILAAKQWLLNYAMLAFPIVWIIAGIAALIYIIVKLVQHWDKVKEAFKVGGILGAIKEIGKVLLDVVLAPLQAILSIIAKITGADWAKNGKMAIEVFRTNMGTYTPEKEGATMPAVSNKVTEQNTLIERIEKSSSKEKIELSYNNMPSNVSVAATAGIAVRGTTTMMGGNV